MLARGAFPVIACKQTSPMIALCSTNNRGNSSNSEKLELYLMRSVLACNIYVSEGHNRSALQAMEDSIQGVPGVHVAHVFVDAPYHRTGFTLTSLNSDTLVAGALALSRAALGLIDLRAHTAKHPRLGALDHISLHHLGVHRFTTPTQASLTSHTNQAPNGPPNQHQRIEDDLQGHTTHPQHQNDMLEHLKTASSAAHAIGQALAGPPSSLPVFYYGCAHPRGRGLAETRRGLGYFKGSNVQQVAGNHVHGNDAAGRAPCSSSIRQSGDIRSSGGAHQGGSSHIHDGRHENCCEHSTPHGSHQQSSSDQANVACSSNEHSAVSPSNHNADQGGTRWQGGLPIPDLCWFPPDEGPTQMTAQHGLVTIGAGPWVVNYNIPVCLQTRDSVDACCSTPVISGASSAPGGSQQGVTSSRVSREGGVADADSAPGDSELLQQARALARGVSERGGGLRLVESMALSHEDGVVEVACNLLGGAEGTAPADVQAFVERMAESINLGSSHTKLVVRQGYQTGKTPQQLVEVTLNALGEH